jgi:YHS domain-containing protein
MKPSTTVEKQENQSGGKQYYFKDESCHTNFKTEMAKGSGNRNT